MPAAPRPSKKAAKIAYKILGKPAPLREKKSKKQREIDEKIMIETARSSK